MNQKNFLPLLLVQLLGVAILLFNYIPASQENCFWVLKSKGRFLKSEKMKQFTNHGTGFVRKKIQWIIIDSQFPDFIQP